MRKEGHRHFMAKEIHEQPRVLAQTISGRIADSGRDVVLDGVGLTGDQVRELEHVQIVACGTSWHAGLLGRYLIEGLAGIPVRVDYGSEFRGRAALLPKRSLFLTISQSGETADTLTALRGIRGQGVRTLDGNGATTPLTRVPSTSSATAAASANTATATSRTSRPTTSICAPRTS